MPILQLPTNPSRGNEPPSETPGEDAQPKYKGLHPLKVHTRRHGELEEHELIHLLDSLDDERAKAQFREAVYISTIFCLAIAWFLFYGPHVLFHQPYYRDPISLMKEHDQQLTLTLPPTAPVPKVAPKVDKRTMQELQKMEEAQKLAHPQPPAPTPPAPQQEQAHTTAPPVPQPLAPLPAAPRTAPSIDAPLPAAPRPNTAQNSDNGGNPLANLGRGTRGGATLPAPGAPGPLQPGAQILSDTQGVDFSAYLRRLLSDTKRNWEPLIPEEANPPISKRGITWIRFVILPDGRIGDMKLETPSGDVALDRAAWGAITSEGQYPPLPREFHGPDLELRLGFFCNTPIQ